MCGIIGLYLKNAENNVQLLIDSLSRLQNRGNDSFGIGTFLNTIPQITKSVNPDKKSISQVLLNKIDPTKYLSNRLIGHSRWATHGENSEINAHPHLDYTQTFLIVHNGTIDNYQSLKTFLEQNQIDNQSQTDTETIVNLISFHYQKFKTNHDNPIRQAIISTTDMLQGCWACILISVHDPTHIWSFSKDCPLIIGWTSNCDKIIITSETRGLSPEVDKYSHLKENTVYRFGENELVPSDKNWTIKLFDPITLHKITPEPYSHWMIREINEQVPQLQSILNLRIIDNKVSIPELENVYHQLINSKNILLCGCGTSFYAASYSKQFLQQVESFNVVQSIDASNFIQTDIPKMGNTTAILFSQSGETMDLIRVQKYLKQLNITTIALINVDNSTISNNSDAKINIQAGNEVSVASTKSYSCQIITLALISIWIKQNLNQDISTDLESIKNISSQLHTVIQTFEKNTKQMASELVDRNITSLFVLGKTGTYHVANEACLKLKEIAYIHAESYPSSALKHGPYSLIQPGYPIILTTSKDQSDSHIGNTISEIKSRGALVWVISDYSDDQQFHLADKIIILPFNQKLYSILHVTIFQLLAYHVAIQKKQNPDYPRNLAKCVTVD